MVTVAPLTPTSAVVVPITMDEDASRSGSPEGGSGSPEGGSGSPEGGSGSPDTGSGSPEGGSGSPEGGSPEPLEAWGEEEGEDGAPRMLQCLSECVT